MKRLVTVLMLSTATVSAYAAQRSDADIDLSKYERVGKVVRICDISDEESAKTVEKKSATSTSNEVAKSGGSALKVASIRRVSECEIYVSKDSKKKDLAKALSGDDQSGK